MEIGNAIIFKPSGGGLDDDAQAFLTATGITDTTISGAINTLVIALKDASIWYKMKAIYPIVGGTSATHKYNLKDARDLDAAFRLSMSGTIYHSSSGMNNVDSGIVNTHLKMSEFGSNYAHLSFYATTDFIANTYQIGVRDNSDNLISAKFSSTSAYISNKATIPEFKTLTSSSSFVKGFVLSSRDSSSQVSYYQNNSKLGTITSNFANVSDNTYPIYILSINLGGIYYGPSVTRCSFATIGYSLSETESSNLYTIIQAFQTTLNRQV